MMHHLNSLKGEVRIKNPTYPLENSEKGSSIKGEGLTKNTNWMNTDNGFPIRVEASPKIPKTHRRIQKRNSVSRKKQEELAL